MLDFAAYCASPELQSQIWVKFHITYFRQNYNKIKARLNKTELGSLRSQSKDKVSKKHYRLFTVFRGISKLTGLELMKEKHK